MEHSIRIVPMGSEHVMDMADLEAACFSEAWTAAQLAYELDNPHAVYFCAVHDGRTVGFAGMHNVLGEGYITNVAVLEEFRRRGIAYALLQELFEYAAGHAMAFLTLEVRQSNDGAIRLYEKCGFTRQGIRRRFYQNPSEDALLMTKFFVSGEGTDCDEDTGDRELL
ncbi:MAG: ribosomal protein S18-alanine N-acetyltransferase [Oscillospiraceae bacterium]